MNAVVYPAVRNGLIHLGWNLSEGAEKILMKEEFGWMQETVNEFTGSVIRTPKSCADMRKHKMCEYIDFIILWAWENCGVSVPPPDKEWWRQFQRGEMIDDQAA